MPRIEFSGQRILDYLLERSGVIREPVPDKIDFVHRTVQEYLTAAKITDNHDIDFLVGKAHLDQWHETVIMAAGHADSKLRKDLLMGLLHRAESEARYARKLRILTTACLETLTDVPLTLRDKVDNCLSSLIPPRSVKEAQSLASAGEEVLRYLPDDLDEFSEGQSVAIVRTCWQINGPDALRKLTAYGLDSRTSVQRELITGWEYFEPREYAEQVLANTPLKCLIHVRTPQIVPNLRYLKHMKDLFVSLYKSTIDLEFLTHVPPLRSLTAFAETVTSLDALKLQPSLESLRIHIGEDDNDVEFLRQLTKLKYLHLTPTNLNHLGFLDYLPSLHILGLSSLDSAKAREY
jgi:hypothetical protein